MADPSLPQSVDRDAGVAKASSASPALTPVERAREERRGYATQFQRDAQREQEKREQSYVLDDGDRPRNVIEAGVGRPLTGAQVRQRLLLLNPALIFEPSTYPGRVCIKKWINDPVLGETLHYLCAMEEGLMPEYSILHFIEEEYYDATTLATPEGTGLKKTRVKIDEHNPETRGWRTILVRLIEERLISEAGATRLFGLPSMQSRNWQARV